MSTGTIQSKQSKRAFGVRQTTRSIFTALELGKRLSSPKTEVHLHERIGTYHNTGVYPKPDSDPQQTVVEKIVRTSPL